VNLGVYLTGFRGIGKMSLQMLLAMSLKEEGYEMYFFMSAKGIPQGADLSFKSVLKDKTKKVAVLIDEVYFNTESELFILLLKGVYPNLVTIGGASVPRDFPSGLIEVFKSDLKMSHFH